MLKDYRMKRKILVIYTGGTIGMMKNAQTGALEPFRFDDVYTHLPMLRLIDATIAFEEMTPLIDSSDTNPEFWVKLADRIYQNYDSYDGFVILHGTDTMAYTASALSFLLENLAKPVILTGSQLPLGVIRTDGRENIVNSIEIAADTCEGKPRVPEVCICFGNALYRGNRAYKANAENFDAFTSANYPALAEIGTSVKYNDSHIRELSKKQLILHRHLDDNIAVLKIYPGITHQLVKTVLETPGLRAVVLETFGAGNAPTYKEFLSLLRQAAERGIVLVNVTQCKGGGGVELGKYATSLALQKIGVVSGYDLTTEAAVTKLMYLLGKDLSSEEVRRQMEVPICGEMSV